MRPVDALLLNCLGNVADPELASRLQLLTAAQWDELVQQSLELRVAPLLYRRLKSLGGQAVPAEPIQRLRGNLFASALANLRLYHQLAGILTILSSAALPVIVLKGAHLAEAVYGDIALRPMTDIDLLVRPTDLPDIEHKLAKLGYRRVRDQGISEVVFLPSEKGVHVELHGEVQCPHGSRQVDTAGLWERAQPARLAGCQALALAPEDQLLYLCQHTAIWHRYEYQALRSLCDVAQTTHHYRDEIKWEQLQDRACQWGIAHAVCLTLYLARTWLGAAMPDRVLHGLHPAGLERRVIGAAEQRIFAQPGPKTVDRTSDRWGRLHAAEGLLGKVIAFLQACFPPRQELADRYSLPPGSKRVNLYYGVYWEYLIQRHAATACQLLTRNDKTQAWLDREAGRVILEQWLTSA